MVNEEFDVDHFAQVQFDMLLLEESCRQISSLPEPKKVAPVEVSGIINSLIDAKAQDVHGLATEHLKHAVDLIFITLANLIIVSDVYIPPPCLMALLPQYKRRIKIPLTTKG